MLRLLNPCMPGANTVEIETECIQAPTKLRQRQFNVDRACPAWSVSLTGVACCCTAHEANFLIGVLGVDLASTRVRPPWLPARSAITLASSSHGVKGEPVTRSLTTPYENELFCSFATGGAWYRMQGPRSEHGTTPPAIQSVFSPVVSRLLSQVTVVYIRILSGRFGLV